MWISQDTIQAVQNNVSIVEIIEYFVPLKRRGNTLWACCPFHHEKTPSFSVSPEKGFYKCFGCDASGDTITFIQEMEGFNFIDAVSFLAKKYGIPIQYESHATVKLWQKGDNDLYQLLDLAKDYYTNVLLQNFEKDRQHSVLLYLEERKISVDFIKKFELGYSLDTWHTFHEFAQQKGYTDAVLLQTGLLIQKEGIVYDRFRGRLMFPIHNVFGHVVAFGARIVSNDKNEPKYINSPETKVYYKGEELYGLYHAKQKIRQEDCCYLVEGYTDVITLHIAGIQNVVASLGTSMTAKQIELISRFTKNIVILFDGDSAGIKAALRGIDLILEKGLHVKVVLLPEGEDPDSYGRKVGGTALKQYIATHVQNFIPFKIRQLVADPAILQDPVQQTHTIKEIIQSIAVVPNELARALYIKQCSKLLGLKEEILLTELHRILIEREDMLRQQEVAKKRTKAFRTTSYQGRGIVKMDQLLSNIEVYEREVVRILLHYGSQKISEDQLLYTYMLFELKDVQFQSSKFKLIMNYFQEQLKIGKVVDLAHCIQQGHSIEIKKIAIDLAASAHEISELWQKRYSIYTSIESHYLHQVAFQSILRLKLRIIQHLIEENRQGLQQVLTTEEEETLLKVHQELKTTEMSIATQLGIVVTALHGS